MGFSSGQLHPFLTLAFLLLSQTGGESLPGQICCEGEQKPLSNCSFYSTKTQRDIPCNITQPVSDLGCDASKLIKQWIKNDNEIPGPPTNLQVKTFLTQCTPNLRAEDTNIQNIIETYCPRSCGEMNGSLHVGLNITFELNGFSASKLSAIEISLFGLNGLYHQQRDWCVLYEYGTGSITKQIADEHTFYYDGFIGLIPGYEYKVFVSTLPTTKGADNTVSQEVSVPYESVCTGTDRPACLCPEGIDWKANVRYHDVPFALNMSLFLDVHTPFVHIIESYYIFVMNQQDLYKPLLAETIQNNESNGCSYRDNAGQIFCLVTLNCIEPGSYRVEVMPTEGCSTCSTSYFDIVVKAEAPIIHNCTGNQTFTTDDRDALEVRAHFLEPVAESPNDNCTNLKGMSSNSSHKPGDLFRVNSATLVTYNFWQYEEATTPCSFYVIIQTELPEADTWVIIVGICCGILLVAIVAIFAAWRIFDISDSQIAKSCRRCSYKIPGCPDKWDQHCNQSEEGCQSFPEGTGPADGIRTLDVISIGTSIHDTRLDSLCMNQLNDNPNLPHDACFQCHHGYNDVYGRCECNNQQLLYQPNIGNGHAKQYDLGPLERTHSTWGQGAEKIQGEHLDQGNVHGDAPDDGRMREGDRHREGDEDNNEEPKSRSPLLGRYQISKEVT